ncbi:hypothetical protein NXX09_08960 [Bacteroides uniformis]|nr:hypothetical protein [Bacteroides uniformis]
MWEHVSTLIRILKLSVCGSVKVRQSVDREYEREEYKTYTATCPFLHLQMCRSSNPLMETREETMKQAGPVHSAGIVMDSPFLSYGTEEEVRGSNRYLPVLTASCHVFLSGDAC